MSVKFKDYYEVLGVPRDATEKAIKDAYRKLARQYHPDLQTIAAKKKSSEEKFKEINEAYEVLGDSEKRKKYNRLGSRWKDGMEFTPPGGGPSEGWTWTSGGGNAGGFSDFFEALFGGRGGPFAGGRTSWGTEEGFQQAPNRGSDLEAELALSLEELAQGGTRRVSLTTHDQAGHLRPKELDITLPKGLRAGERIRLKGQGATNGRGTRPGDLYLKIRLRPHPLYTVDESSGDLQMDLPLLPWEAVLGADVMVPTLQEPVSLRIPAGSQAGQRLRLRGKGLPRRDNGHGDLYVRLVISVPKSIGARERELYKELAGLSTEDPRSALDRARSSGR